MVVGGINMTIGEKILKLRTDQNLTQKQLANICGFSQSALNFWENGKRQPKIEQLEKIANALDVSVADLMGLTYKENIMDTNDLFKFYDSLGYIVKPIDENSYHLVSRDITNRIKLILTWQDLQKIKDDTWKYLKFTLNDWQE